jgi:starch synthase (maltosyl-transferring)
MRDDGRRRVIIEGVAPEIDCGRFAVKRTLGQTVTVEADVFADGHDSLTCLLLWRPAADPGWNEVRMTAVDPLPQSGAPGNDRWRGSFTVSELGTYLYTLHAWIDHWQTWRRDLEKRVAAGQDVSLDLRIGAALIEQAGERAREGGRQADARVLAGLARDLGKGLDVDERLRLALDAELAELMDRHADRRFATAYGRELAVSVNRERARFSAWYELFPRSTAPLLEAERETESEPRHGTFGDLEERLKYVAGMGFDIVYLPPIHPIGQTHRKGKNNARTAEPGDVGSPWAIGAAEGGHKAIHPELGTPEDFRRLVERARELGMEIALDVAFQCSPDHPLVAEHPEWFRRRPDGTIQYAENPPKKYEDIYPFDFESEDWRGLWEELKSVFDHWIGEGVRVFRVDNPHTKSFAFWEWAIAEIRREHPDVIFLSEAFTRPKIMYRLAKLGFTQSYTYFAWRRHKQEITEYMTQLTTPPVVEFFRPNFWPNTPDILTDQLQTGERAMFVQRFLLAATLTANYGIYGPAFELLEHVPIRPGSEEYRDSEKYQIRRWDLDRPDSLRELIAHVNRIRRGNPALHSDRSIRFHAIENDQLIVYSKATADFSNVILIAVTLDTRQTQSGWVSLDLPALGLAEGEAFQVHDLLTGARYSWQGGHNYVQLDPEGTPAHIFRIQRAGETTP